jgi:hypothetical protein
MLLNSAHVMLQEIVMCITFFNKESMDYLIKVRIAFQLFW